VNFVIHPIKYCGYHMRGIPIPDFFGKRPAGKFPAQAPPVPAETRGLAGSRMTVQPWAGERRTFGNCRYMNGHRDGHVPEILREVPERAQLLRYRKARTHQFLLKPGGRSMVGVQPGKGAPVCPNYDNSGVRDYVLFAYRNGTLSIVSILSIESRSKERI